MAAAWLSLCGFEVAWPLEPCRYDLIASKDGRAIRVQVKTTRTRRSRTWVVSLHSTSRKEGVYDPDDIDHFFIIDGDLAYYLVPIAAVGGFRQINLTAYQHFRLDRSGYGLT